MITSHHRTVGLAVLLAAALAVHTAQAQELGSFPFDRFSVTVGSFYETTDSDLRLDAGTADQGTLVSLERDLGLEDSDQLLRFGLEWRPFERHQLSGSYYELSRDASQTLARDIQIGDTVFPLRASLSSSSESQYYEAVYTFWAVKKPRGGLGLSLGVAGIALEARFTAEVPRPGGNGTLTLEESASSDLPVPLVGVEGRYAFARRFLVAGEVRALPSVQIEDYEGTALVYGVRLEYRLSRNFGLGASWSSFNIDAEVERQSFQGALDFTIEGAQAFLRVAL